MSMYTSDFEVDCVETKYYRWCFCIF